MPLSGNALIAHDQTYAVGQALQTLQTAMAAALPVLQGAGLTDSHDRIKALSDAVAPAAQPVLDAMNSYQEAQANQP